jgi:hypothetical protein
MATTRSAVYPRSNGRGSTEAYALDDALGGQGAGQEDPTRAGQLAVDEALGGQSDFRGNNPGRNQATTPRDTSARDQAVGSWFSTLQQGQNPTDAYKRAYQHFLGRDVDPDSLAGFDPNRGLLAYVNDLYDSDEGAAFRARGGQGTSATGGLSPGRGNIPLGAGSGVANQQNFTGFNFGREHDRNKSAKDSFAHWGGQHAGAADWRTKAGAEAWFRQYVMPGMQADGFEILDVQGDKAFVRTVENPEGTWIDFVQGADGDNPLLAWQDQSYGGDVGGGGGGSAYQDNATQGVGQPALNMALTGGSPSQSFSMLDYLMQAMATNRLFDPNSNLMLSGR